MTSASAAGAGVPAGANFHTLTPCRVFDSRQPSDAPPLDHGVARLIQITGAECGVPANASSVALNMTAVSASADGDLVLYPGDQPAPAPPRPGAMPFKAGKTRSKIDIVHLAFDGAGDINALATMSAGATTDAIIDVNGYFVNDAPPIAVDDTATVAEDDPATAIDVLANDTDAENDPFSIASASGFANGTVELTPAGPGPYTGLTYQPNANYCGPDSFTYTLTPGGDSGLVSVTVTCVNDAPVPVADAFQVIGNTELRVDMVAGTTPHTPETTPGASSYEGMLDNDGDPEGDPVSVTGVVGCLITDTTAPFDCTLAGGAVVHVDANGEFSFTPGPGATTGSFQYTITDAPAFGTAMSANGTVTFTFSEMVWYVNNSGGAGNGTSIAPLNAITGTNIGDTSGDGDLTDDLDDASDYIFIYFGNGTDSGQNGGLQLEVSQHLLGEFAGLSIPVNLNGNGSPTVLVAPPAATDCSGGPCRPLLSNTAGSAVTASDNDGVAAPVIGTIPVEIVGMSLQGSVNAIDLTTNTALSGSPTLTILQNVFRGAGAEGIDVNLDAGTTGTLALNVLTNSWNLAGTHTGNAVDINRAAGTLNLSFSANADIVSAAVGGTAVSISGGAAANTTITGFAGNSISGNTAGHGVVISNVTFDSVAGGGVTQVDGDNLAIGAGGNPVGGAGMSISGLGSLFFDDLDIFAGASGLTVNGVAFAVTPASPDGSGTSTIDADNGAAVDISNSALDLRLDDLESNTAGSGVNLNTVSGQFRAPSGSAITKASGGGTAFAVASSSATVNYFGTLNVTSGSGVGLTSNTDAVNFTGLLTLSTGADAAFSATGASGTVTATNTASTIGTTTGTALNVNGPDLGVGGLVFRSIAANGAASGIILQDTGATAGLTVSGTGTAGTGGTIQSTTSDGVRLTNARNVSLSFMNFTNIAAGTTNAACHFENVASCEAAVDMSGVTNITLDDVVIDHNDAGHIGIAGNNVNGFSLTDSSVLDVGESDAESAILMQQLSGTVLIEDVTIDDPAEYGMRVYQPAGTALLNLTLRRVTVQNNISTFGEAGFSIRAADGTSRVLVDDCDFLSTDGPGIDGQAINDATLHLTVQGTTFTENRALPMAVNFTTDNTSDGFVKISNNTVTDCATPANCSVAFDLDANRTSVLHATVSNNSVATGTGIGTGMEFVVGDGATGRAEVRDNTFVMNSGEIGMTFHARSEGFGGTNGRLDVIFEGNSISGIQDAGLFNPGVQFLAGSSTGTHDQDVCVHTATSAGAGGNTITGINNPGFTPRFEVTQRTGTVFILEGFTGTGTNAASVGSHFDTNNTATTLDPTFVRSSGTAIVNYTTGTCNTPTTPTLP